MATTADVYLVDDSWLIIETGIDDHSCQRAPGRDPTHTIVVRLQSQPAG